MPPWIWRLSCETRTAISPIRAVAIEATSGASARRSATALAASTAAALPISRYIPRSAMMCLSDWYEPMGRPNAVRSLA